MTIETSRLKIYTAPQEEMIRIINTQTDDILKKAYQEMLQGCFGHPEQWVWYVIWIIESIQSKIEAFRSANSECFFSFRRISKIP